VDLDQALALEVFLEQRTHLYLDPQLIPVRDYSEHLPKPPHSLRQVDPLVHQKNLLQLNPHFLAEQINPKKLPKFQF
jgi:hypothetical protein